MSESSAPAVKDPKADEQKPISDIEQIHRAFQPPPAKTRAKRNRVYRVGALKVPLVRAENMRGGRGKLARRLKAVLARMSSPKDPLPDFDTFEPPRQPARSAQVRRSSRMGLRDRVPHDETWTDTVESDENE